MLDNFFDPDAYWQTGKCPWTFFAYPTSLADARGLPPDEDVNRLLAELKSRGIRVGIWTHSPVENTTYFACPKEDIQRLKDALTELEQRGAIAKDFLRQRCNYLEHITK